MPKLAIVGYGKMGRLIDQLAPEYGFQVTARVDVDRDESIDGAEVAVEFSPLRRKELTLYNVRRSNQDSEAARDMLAGNLARFAPLITHVRPLARIAEAFSQLEHYAGGVGKLIIQPHS